MYQSKRNITAVGKQKVMRIDVKNKINENKT